MAEGFLRIAVENMANAIKKISVQRGYDVTKYTMNCFGGAGGQHACLVADALGMESVFIHPFAGVLSAFGIGLADVRAMREHQFGLGFDQIKGAEVILDRLITAAEAEVAGQGIPSDQITTVTMAHIRPDGAQQTLEVPFGTMREMTHAFETAHLQRFGFVPENASLLIDVLTAEAIGATGENVTLPDTGKTSSPPKHRQMWSNGKVQNVPVIDRTTMCIGEIVQGPAIITEPTGTNILEQGWEAECVSGGNLVLRRTSTVARQEAVGTKVDPVMLEVFNNLFMSIADQMGVTLANTAYSVNIKERYDFSCAIFDEAGTRIIYTVASRGHHADIGGKTPGSAPPDSRVIEEEGVLIDNFLLVQQGNLRDAQTRELLASGKYPCRNINQNMADLSAQIAANATGAGELTKITQQFGLDTVHAYMTHVQDNAEESVRRVLDVLRDCTFTYPLDSGDQIKVAITVDKSTRQATIDFTGTSGQNEFNYNAPLAICRAVVLYVFRTLVGSDIPMNEGCLKPLNLIVPEGSMINPKAPAAVISGNTEVSQAIADTLYGALGVIAGSQGTMNNFVYGNDEHQNYETICGGTGAGDGFHGTSAVHSHMTNTRMTDPEVLETRFPVRVDEFSIRSGSGGGGEYCGGNGIVRKLRFLEPMTVTVLSSHRIVSPHGAAGGGAGAVGENSVERADGHTIELKGNDEVQLAVGDVFVMKTPGGGGYGKATK